MELSTLHCLRNSENPKKNDSGGCQLIKKSVSWSSRSKYSNRAVTSLTMNNVNQSLSRTKFWKHQDEKLQSHLIYTALLYGGSVSVQNIFLCKVRTLTRGPWFITTHSPECSSYYLPQNGSCKMTSSHYYHTDVHTPPLKGSIFLWQYVRS